MAECRRLRIGRVAVGLSVPLGIQMIFIPRLGDLDIPQTSEELPIHDSLERFRKAKHKGNRFGKPIPFPTSDHAHVILRFDQYSVPCSSCIVRIGERHTSGSIGDIMEWSTGPG
jgi:hypothetical protein